MSPWATTALVLSNLPTYLLPPTVAYNASHAVTVEWHGPHAGLPAGQAYQLQMSIARPGMPTFHVTRQAPRESRMLFWPDIPHDADSCFSVAVVSEGDYRDDARPAAAALSAAPTYSEATCVRRVRCLSAAGGGEASGAPSGAGGGGDGGSCASCALFGAFLGAIAAAVATAVCMQRDGRCHKHAASLARSLVGGEYSHVRTAEEPAMVELDAPRIPSGSDRAVAAAGGAAGVGAFGSVGGGGDSGSLLPALDPPADINADQFELRWSSCAHHSYVLDAPLPSLPPSAPDEIEAALVRLHHHVPPHPYSCQCTHLLALTLSLSPDAGPPRLLLRRRW